MNILNRIFGGQLTNKQKIAIQNLYEVASRWKQERQNKISELQQQVVNSPNQARASEFANAYNDACSEYDNAIRARMNEIINDPKFKEEGV